MNEDFFNRLKSFITVYGQGAVNINTAPRQVLLAVGIEKGVVNKIIIYRGGDDEEEKTLDDNVFSAPSSIVAELSQSQPLSSSEVANLSNLVSAGLLTTGSDYFMVRSQAQLEYSSAMSEIVCVTDRAGKIVFWREI